MNLSCVLSKVIRQRGIPVSEVAKIFGVNQNAVHRYLNTRKNKNSDDIFSGTLRLAFDSDLQVETLQSLLSPVGVQVTTTLVASVIFPDISPKELLELRKVEELTGISPLHGDIVRSTVMRFRSAEKPQD